MLCTCAGCSGLRSVYHCQPTQLAKEAFLQGRRLEDNQSIRKTPMLIGANKMLGYSIAVVVHEKEDFRFLYPILCWTKPESLTV